MKRTTGKNARAEPTLRRKGRIDPRRLKRLVRPALFQRATARRGGRFFRGPAADRSLLECTARPQRGCGFVGRERGLVADSEQSPTCAVTNAYPVLSAKQNDSEH